MFTNKADIDIRCSPSKFDRKEVEILSVKNLGFKKYINISNLKNNRTIDKVC
jgi:hypothetical protein